MQLLAPVADALGAGRPLRRIPLPVLHAGAAVVGALVVATDTGFAGGPTSDRIWAAAFAAFVSFCCAYARRWAWLIVAGITAAVAAGPAQIAGIALLIWAMFAAGAARRSRHVGAVLGGVAGVVLLTGGVVAPPVHAGAAAAATIVAAWSAYRTTPRAQRVLPRRLALGALVLVGAALAGYAAAAQGAREHALGGIDMLRDGLDAAEDRDTTVATNELRRAAGELRAARDDLSTPWARPARFLPFVGANARAVDQLARSGAELASTAADAVTTIDIDQIDLRAGRVDLDLARQISDSSARVDDEIALALDGLDDRRSIWLLDLVDEQVVEAIDLLREAQPAVRNVRDAARIAPQVLGGDTPRRYLVLFTTPVEARARIGFPGNFAELEASDGQIRLVKFGRVASDLQNRGLPLGDRRLSGPAEYLARYDRFAPAQTWPNITMSPDFPTVAAVAAELYPQSGGRAVDGVLQVDPTALAALLALTGPVSVPELATPISSQNAAEFLHRGQYATFRGTQRVDMLEAVALVTFERLTSGDLPGLDDVADVLAPVVADGHLRFASFDPDVAPVLRRAGLDGAFPEVAGDSLAVLTTNAGANKLDAFIERATSYDVAWDPATGDFRGQLTVAFTNTAPVATLPDYVLGVTPPPRPGAPAVAARGTHRMLVSVYTPWLPEGATVDGVTAAQQVERELGRYVGTTIVDVPPGATVTLTTTWQGRLAPAGTYALDLVHQPQANPEPVRIRVAATGEAALDTSRGTLAGRTVTVDEQPTRDLRLVVQARLSR